MAAPTSRARTVAQRPWPYVESGGSDSLRRSHAALLLAVLSPNVSKKSVRSCGTPRLASRLFVVVVLGVIDWFVFGCVAVSVLLVFGSACVFLCLEKTGHALARKQQQQQRNRRHYSLGVDAAAADPRHGAAALFDKALRRRAARRARALVFLFAGGWLFCGGVGCVSSVRCF
jgi:hypothetical protein